jgi:hypothetical protein
MMKRTVFVTQYHKNNEDEVDEVDWSVFATAAAAEHWRQQIARERWLEQKQALAMMDTKTSFEATLSFRADRSLASRLRDCDSDASAARLLFDALREDDDAVIGDVLIQSDKKQPWERVRHNRNSNNHGMPVLSHLGGPPPDYYDPSDAAGRPSDDPRADADAWFDGNHGDYWSPDWFGVEEAEVWDHDDIRAFAVGDGDKGTEQAA